MTTAKSHFVKVHKFQDDGTPPKIAQSMLRLDSAGALQLDAQVKWSDKDVQTLAMVQVIARWFASILWS